MNKYLKLSFIFTGLYVFLILTGLYPFLRQYYEIFNFSIFYFGIVDYLTLVVMALAAVTGVVAIFQARKEKSKWAFVALILGIANILYLLSALYSLGFGLLLIHVGL